MGMRRLPGLLPYFVLQGCGDWVCHRHLGTLRGKTRGLGAEGGEAPCPDTATELLNQPAPEQLYLSTSHHRR